MQVGSLPVDSSPSMAIPASSLAAFGQPEAAKVARVFNGIPGRRILIVENDTDLANFLAVELQEHHFVVDILHDPEQAVEALQGRVWYDLLILDLSLPEGDGISLIHRLRPTLPRLPMMVLTARNGVEEKVRAFEAGADDCVSKPLFLSELLARVKALMRRNSGMVPNCSRVGDLIMHREERRVERNGRRIDLTPREFAILDLLLRNTGRPVSRATLLNEVWNLPGQPSTNIVNVYMKYVRDKVDLPGEPRLTHTVRGFGYELREG